MFKDRTQKLHKMLNLVLCLWSIIDLQVSQARIITQVKEGMRIAILEEILVLRPTQPFYFWNTARGPETMYQTAALLRVLTITKTADATQMQH